MGFLAFWRRNKKAAAVDPLAWVPRVRVRDSALNRSNGHWAAMIGHEGIFLGKRVDEEGEIWDVQMDGHAIPHSMIDRERFDLLPARVNEST
jgi:hypothetical protein